MMEQGKLDEIYDEVVGKPLIAILCKNDDGLNEYAEDHERLHIIDTSKWWIRESNNEENIKLWNEVCYKIAEKISELVNKIER